MIELSLIARGLIVGFFPTFAMVLATFLLTRIEVSAHVEAALQNFAAGLILAAVAAEVFPVLTESENVDSFIGISIGFFIGLSTIYGIEHLVEYIEETPESELFRIKKVTDVVKTFPKGLEPTVTPQEGGNDNVVVSPMIEDVYVHWEDHEVERSSRAISTPQHRGHIAEHLQEVLELISGIESKSATLSSSPEIPIGVQEELAEQIDEAIHSLQYKLDHARRLLQGSETNLSHENPISTWVTGERKENIEKNIVGLRHTVEHLLEHIHEPNLDKEVVREMRVHMDHMDKQISLFHETIETAASKWHRLLPKIETNEGDTLPMGLVLPVCLDCFVDGFLIGLSSVISVKAGIILSFANCLEMSFLGMAYSARIKKCTGSTYMVRMIALYGPPWIMFIAAGVGALLGSVVESVPAVFIAMVAFGAVALLFLVCNELLIEAREAQGEDERWYIGLQVFVGIYLVLMVNHVI